MISNCPTQYNLRIFQRYIGNKPILLSPLPVPKLQETSVMCLLL